MRLSRKRSTRWLRFWLQLAKIYGTSHTWDGVVSSTSVTGFISQPVHFCRCFLSFNMFSPLKRNSSKRNRSLKESTKAQSPLNLGSSTLCLPCQVLLISSDGPNSRNTFLKTCLGATLFPSQPSQSKAISQSWLFWDLPLLLLCFPKERSMLFEGFITGREAPSIAIKGVFANIALL